MVPRTDKRICRPTAPYSEMLIGHALLPWLHRMGRLPAIIEVSIEVRAGQEISSLDPHLNNQLIMHHAGYTNAISHPGIRLREFGESNPPPPPLASRTTHWIRTKPMRNYVANTLSRQLVQQVSKL